MEYICECFQRQAMQTTFGLLQPPLGNVRLHVAKLVSALLLTNVHGVNVELASLGTLELLWVSYVNILNIFKIVIIPLLYIL